jgi:CO/xanthine dehydrogenase FAD-binding subunit
VPSLAPEAGFAFEEFTQRHGDFAIVGVAAVIEADAAGRCATARLAVAGAGSTPIRTSRAEAFLRGQPLIASVLEEAGRLVSQQVEPEADLHASEDFRRHLAGTMATRALVRAAERTAQRNRRR